MYTGDIIKISLTAKDSNGNLVKTGGDIFTVKISNLCTKYNAYYCWPSGTTGPLSANVNDVMADHNNGTYTYSYTLSVAGSVSVQVYLLTQGQVYEEYYSGIDFNGSSIGNCEVNYLDFYKNISSSCCTNNQNFSSDIIGSILAPFTGDTKFQFTCDDYCTVYIDDIYHVANQTTNFDLNLIANKYYPLFVKFVQGPGDYSFNTTWSYSGLSLQSIPITNIFLTSLVANSPYAIITTANVCGDARRTGSEACDDGNISNGDGCSSTCTVESGYKCTGGSITSKDTCSLEFKVSKQENVVAILTVIAFSVGAFASFCASLLSSSSPVSVFSMINQFQLLYIPLASGIYVSDGVFNLITGLSFVLFDFSFIKIEELYIFTEIYSYLSFEQTNTNLNKIGIVDGSSFIVLLKLILMTAILGFIHVIFIPIYLKCRKIDQRNICARIGNSLYPIFTFNVYVRIFISAYITILFSCFGEMYEFQVKTVVEITSYCFNILICVIIFAFYGLCIWQIKKAHPKLNSVKQFCFIEFFSGFKDKTTSRIYSAIFFSQRILSCLLVITSESLSLSTKMAILSVIQFLSLCYLLISRPYEKAKDLISECLSQSVMTFFCCILIYFNTRSQWNSVINWIFMGTLMTSTAISTLIAFIDLLIIIVKKIRNSCCDDKVRHFRANRPSEVSHIGPDFVNAILKESEAIRKSKEENKESLSSDAGAHNQINNQSHRSMVMASTSAVNSIVTGLENSSMYTGDIIKITVTAKDSSGNFVTTGGDIFTVKISNLCTKYNAYYCWPNGATGPLSANVNDVMADHNNGTY